MRVDSDSSYGGQPPACALYADRPVIRFWLFASRPSILPPKTQVLQYLTNYISILDQADDPHLRAASWAGQGINLPNLFDKLSPGLGWCPRRLVIRYVQYGEIHAVLFSGWFISRSQHSLLTPLPFCPV